VIKVLGIDHINFATADVSDGISFWSDLLGIEFPPVRELEREDIRVSVSQDITPGLSVYEPFSTSGPESRTLAKRGEGVTVIVFAVENLKDAIEHFTSRGLTPIIENARSAFFHPRGAHGVRIQLIEGWMYRSGVDH
jgi:catechol 2,3-dioxygenase-like lactoylglutathione lyase family enzyme